MTKPSNYIVLGGNAYWIDHSPGKPMWSVCPLLMNDSPEWEAAGEVDTARADEHLVAALQSSVTDWLRISQTWETACVESERQDLVEQINLAFDLPIARLERQVDIGAGFDIGGHHFFVGGDLMDGNTVQVQVNHGPGHEREGEAASAGTYHGVNDGSTWRKHSFHTWLRDQVSLVLRNGPTALEIKF